MTADRQRILITGVSRGIGRAMADGFIQRGHVVLGCARSAQAVEQLREQYGSPHRFDALDVADDRRVRQWAESLLADGHAPDLLLNNAALINRNAPLWEVPAGEFDRVIDVNVKGVVNVIRHFTPAMIDRGRGVIVNFSSGWGRSTSPEVAPYCATKWAIEGLSRAMAEEVPRGLAVVAVSPGVVHTDMLESCMGDAAASAPRPEAWATRAVPFLLGLGPKDNGRSLSTP